MKVSKGWLKQLVDFSTSFEELESLLPLRTIALKEVTPKFFELDMKGYNRADLLSLRGVAYEVAAITNSRLAFSETKETDFTWSNQSLPKINVKVSNSSEAPVYCLAKIEGLTVEPSPKEWVEKLEESGIRSVNNIADITNLVMLEYGQPLHAFNAQTVKNETIIVRTAHEGEKLTTLDNKSRELIPSDLLITDPNNILGLAGVMGGKDSEITDETQTILLEAAIFDPVVIRNTSLRLGLTSEASKRFQHGLTKTRLLQALDAAIKLYQQLGGKLTGITIEGGKIDESPKIELNQIKVSSLIGVEIDNTFINSVLEKLYFNFDEISEGKWIVSPPYWRLDIKIEEDVIEEIARLYGYEKIPAQPLSEELPAKINQTLFDLKFNITKELVTLGLSEILTYSFFSTQVINHLSIDKKSLVKLANPMSSETEYLRSVLWPNVLEATVRNLKKMSDVAIFEIGKTYTPQASSLPKEKYILSIALSNNTDTPIEELYFIFLKLAQKLDLEFSIVSNNIDKHLQELFHPTRLVKIISQGEEIGLMGEVHPRTLDKFGSNKRIAVLEISIPSV